GDALYFVYELVHGSSLDRIESVSTKDALRLAIAIASALAEAHRAGFIHRDIKPSNVIVPRAADAELDFSAAKLLDFGVAGALTQRAQGTPTTTVGEIFGSPHYMSPEQIIGAAQSPAADIYGVGALLFRVLYERPVFDGASVVDVWRKIASVDAAFPPNPQVPEPLRALIERCLAKDPLQRFADGAELLRALTSVALGVSPDFALATRAAISSMAAQTDSLSEPAGGRAPELPRTQDSRSRSRWAITAAVGSTLLLAVGGAIWLAKPTLHIPVYVWLMGGIAASWLAAYFVHRAIEKRRAPFAGSVAAVLGRAHAVEDLSKSLALDVEQLLEACRNLDQHMLAKTLALMIGEYDKARESDDRQAALMKAVELMEKLHVKLAPWYVKRQTALTWGVGVIGSAFSAAKTLGELFELLRK
ncbi:MAG TPA: serine/threonine-protein kinase, partial [Polyangiales bacterium]|nr:serine/threonine-protein kinase [Polyangiales bacterium]